MYAVSQLFLILKNDSTTNRAVCSCKLSPQVNVHSPTCWLSTARHPTPRLLADFDSNGRNKLRQMWFFNILKHFEHVFKDFSIRKQKKRQKCIFRPCRDELIICPSSHSRSRPNRLRPGCALPQRAPSPLANWVSEGYGVVVGSRRAKLHPHHRSPFGKSRVTRWVSPGAAAFAVVCVDRRNSVFRSRRE